MSHVPHCFLGAVELLSGFCFLALLVSSASVATFLLFWQQRLLMASLAPRTLMSGHQRLSRHPMSGNSLLKVVFCWLPSDSSDSSSKHFWNHLIPRSSSEFSWCKWGCVLDHIKTFKKHFRDLISQPPPTASHHQVVVEGG